MLHSQRIQITAWLKRVQKFFFRPQRRAVFVFACVTLVAAGLLLAAFPAHAQLNPTDIANGMLQWISTVFLAIARLFIGLTIFGLRFFIKIAEYSGYIDAPTVLIGWIMVRDVANMFFVVALLAIAFGTILGIESYEWKKTLAKLVLAAIFINFSKLIAGLIIDVAQVFMITFLNAISSAAGGNLIRMFNLNELVSIRAVPITEANQTQDLRLDIFMGSVMALVLSGMALVTMGAYVIIMILRVVVLWVLIILSPLAYAFTALPATRQYAQQYWSKFANHVIAGPIMVFFLWLAFATLGTGNIATEIGIDLSQTAQERVQ